MAINFSLLYNNFVLKRTPLYEKHLALGAKIVPFAGWEMPVLYKGIIEEHNAVRKNVGLFDVGHMGTINLVGNQALTLIQKVATNDASKLELNQGQYSVLCNESGGTIDDIFVYRLPMNYLIICNASNFEKVLAWLKKQAQSFEQARVETYENYCSLAVQGPNAEKVVSKALNVDLAKLKRNHVLWWRDIIISRTGYTGEDGFELLIAKKEINKIWDRFISAGVQPCGLGARDTLRLEAGFPLYEHEYNEEVSPLEVGYKWSVKFDKGNFIGKQALLKGPKKKLVGLLPEGRMIARAGDEIVGQGKITSGTFSPTLKKPIALGFINDPSLTSVEILIRGKKVPAQVVAKTFYKR